MNTRVASALGWGAFVGLIVWGFLWGMGTTRARDACAARCGELESFVEDGRCICVIEP